LKIAIIGVGGVGGYIGGHLAKFCSDDNQIYFVARGEHLQQIRESGLKVVSSSGEFTAIPYMVTDDPREIGPVDLLLFCVKSYDLEEAAQLAHSLVNQSTIILPLMNGISHFERLEEIYPGNLVIEACVYIFAHIEKPGVVKEEGGFCQIIMGKDKRTKKQLEPIKDLFAQAGIEAQVVDNPEVPVWSKFLLISPLACITSLYGETVGNIVEEPTKNLLLKNLIEEACEVADKSEIYLPQNIVETTMDKIYAMPNDAITSMHRDFELGNKTELDALCKVVIDLGEKVHANISRYKNIYAILKHWG